MAINYPTEAVTPLDKLAFMLRLKEHVRMQRNIGGKWHRVGLTRAEFDSGVDGSSLGGASGVTYHLTNQAKAAIKGSAFRAQLSRADYASFLATWEPVFKAVEEEINTLRTAMSRSTKWDARIDINTAVIG